MTVEAKTYKQDCVQGLAQRVKAGTANFVFADPPYNIGQEYDAYDDKKGRNEYITWSRMWIDKVADALHPHGAFCLMIGDAFVSDMDMLARENKLYKRQHIIWHFTFGQHNANGLAQSHVHILYYTKHKTKRTMNVDDPEVRVPSARQLKYNDKRANPKGKPPASVWALLPEQLPEGFDPCSNTWLFSRICGTFKEKKKGMPNQLPVPLVERCVRLFSNPGDLVVDPFLGTGTTAVACLNSGRNFVGFDISAKCVKVARDRIKEAAGRQARKKDDDKTLFDS